MWSKKEIKDETGAHIIWSDVNADCHWRGYLETQVGRLRQHILPKCQRAWASQMTSDSCRVVVSQRQAINDTKARERLHRRAWIDFTGEFYYSRIKLIFLHLRAISVKSVYNKNDYGKNERKPASRRSIVCRRVIVGAVMLILLLPSYCGSGRQVQFYNGLAGKS